MKEEVKNLYTPFSDYILRTPNRRLGFLENAIHNEESFNTLLNENNFHEAIYLASPSLYQSMLKLIEKEQSDIGGFEKTKDSILKYLIRMSTRSTPFGLFAGFNLGNFGEENKIVLDNKDQYKKHLRLDMNFLVALAMDLSKQESIRKQLKFYPNTSIYIIGNQIRYVEYFYEKSNRLHRISAVEKSEYIIKVLNNAKNGATINDLAKALVDNEISFEESEPFIYSLIDAQLLISELEPAVTGPEFLDQILFVLKSLEPVSELNSVTSLLERIKTLILELSAQNDKYRLDKYEEIENLIRKTNTKFEKKHLFQLDLVKSIKICTVAKKIPEDILKIIPFLSKLSIRHKESPMQKFKEAFVKRYEEQEIPLLTALDTESGIGYLQNMGGDNSPLVKGLFIPPGKKNDNKPDWHPFYSLLLKKYNDSIKTQKEEIHLKKEDFDELEADNVELPNTISSMVQLIKGQDPEEIIIYLKSIGGSSAANLIGRFCHSDSDTFSHATNIVNKDQELSKAILAEVCHLPESRTGNVLLRPSLRSYEIPYLAKANLDQKHQILPNDLMVSVRNNQIVLRSKKLDKQVIPRNTTAHNFSNNSLPVYHFLCDLQTEGLKGGLYFSWGPLENEFDYFPRVMYKNVILSLETWVIHKKNILDILKIKETKKRLIEFKKHLVSLGVKENIILSDGDNELYINIENNEMIGVLFNLIKNRKSFKLQEFIFNESNLIVEGPGGGYTNEFIFSFYKNKTEV